MLWREYRSAPGFRRYAGAATDHTHMPLARRGALACAALLAAVLAGQPIEELIERAVTWANPMSDRSSDWLVLKYDVLSALVPFTNRVRWSSDRAHDTMHAALWNGSAYDVQVTNRLLWNRTRHLAPERVLDAGCGWGGTVFFLAEARRRAAQGDAGAAVTATYDGLTLSTTQAATAARTATAKGLAGSCRFVVASYEAPLASST